MKRANSNEFYRVSNENSSPLHVRGSNLVERERENRVTRLAVANFDIVRDVRSRAKLERTVETVLHPASRIRIELKNDATREVEGVWVDNIAGQNLT